MMTLALIAVMFLVLCLTGYLADKLAWNGGFCRQTGESWEFFARDSQGGRGYTTKSGKTVWISWPVDSRRQ